MSPLIIRAAAAYELGTPLMTDAAFDALVAELPEAERAALPIGSPARAAGDTAVSHLVPMLSLDNSPARKPADEQALDALRWQVSNFRACEPLTVEPKVDGMSLLLTYHGGTLCRVESRGDGYTGRDITGRAIAWGILPEQLRQRQSGDPMPLDLLVHGELYIPHGSPLLATAPTAQAAAAALLNTQNPQSLPPAAASFVAHTLCPLPAQPLADTYPPSPAAAWAAAYNAAKREETALDILRALNLPVIRPLACAALRDLLPLLESLHTAASRLYPCDGLVLKLNSLRLRSRLGSTKRAPRWALALKRYHTQDPRAGHKKRTQKRKTP